jgi:hypothetical protein
VIAGSKHKRTEKEGGTHLVARPQQNRHRENPIGSLHRSPQAILIGGYFLLFLHALFLLLDVQVFVNLPPLLGWKKIVILGIRAVCLRPKFFSAFTLNKFPKNLKIEF